MKNANLPLIFSYILSFFLSITLCAIIFCTLFLCTVAQPKNFDNAISKSNFIKPLKNEISEKWENLAAISGMEDRDELLSLLTEKRIEKDCREYFKSAYNGESVDTASLKQELYTVVNEYAKDHNPHLIPDAEVSENVNDLVNACMTEYDTSVKIKLLPSLLSRVKKFTPIVIGALIGCSVVSLGLILFIFGLQRGLKSTAKYVFYGVTANTVLFTVLSLLIHFNDFIHRIPIDASALYNLAVAYLSDIFSVLIIITGVLCAISAIILILLNLKRKKAEL